MAEYIECEAAIRALTLHDCDSAGAKIAILDMPAADVAPVVHARWIGGYENNSGRWTYRKPRCSECGEENNGTRKYCPNCGAKMDEDEK